MDKDELLKAVENQHLHRLAGLKIISTGKDGSHLSFKSTPETINPAGKLHGGILNALLDVSCFVALIPFLKSNQNAVTHNASFSNIRALGADQEIELRATVTARAATIAFVTAEATWKGKIVATASLTKSIVTA